MSRPVANTHPLLSLGYQGLVLLPTPANISTWWNLGFNLRAILITQLITGVLLAIHYTSGVEAAFTTALRIRTDVNYGWLLRSVHANGASIFFLLIYGHVGRGLYYRSYVLHETWGVGVLILFILIATAFLGYVLPWGQISFWGATVITNLISAIPYVGETVVYWVWGGFRVGNSTLTRFFALHFLTPFVILGFVLCHLLFLHQTGSTNPTGLSRNFDKIPFHPYYTLKDAFSVFVVLVSLLTLSTLNPWLFGDAENFTPADPIVTPVHIKPEWYFLFAYAILRAVPNKLGGVLGLVLSIAILFLLPLASSHVAPRHPLSSRKLAVWLLVGVFILLSWIGGNSVEDPYIAIGQTLSVVYFLLFLWLIAQDQ